MDTTAHKEVARAAAQNKLAQQASVEAAEHYRAAIFDAIDGGATVAEVAGWAQVGASRIYSILQARADKIRNAIDRGATVAEVSESTGIAPSKIDAILKT